MGAPFSRKNINDIARNRASVSSFNHVELDALKVALRRMIGGCPRASVL